RSLSLRPPSFEGGRGRRVQLLTALSDSFVQGISIKTRWGRQVIPCTEQPARALCLSLHGGDLRQPDQSPDDAEPTLHALNLSPEHQATLIKSFRCLISTIVVLQVECGGL